MIVAISTLRLRLGSCHGRLRLFDLVQRLVTIVPHVTDRAPTTVCFELHTVEVLVVLIACYAVLATNDEVCFTYCVELRSALICGAIAGYNNSSLRLLAFGEDTVRSIFTIQRFTVERDCTAVLLHCS